VSATLDIDSKCGLDAEEKTPFRRITTGSVKTSVDEKKALAKVSHAHNIQNKKFRDLFPEVRTLSYPMMIHL
jgi:hypothetical protein